MRRFQSPRTNRLFVAAVLLATHIAGCGAPQRPAVPEAKLNEELRAYSRQREEERLRLAERLVRRIAAKSDGAVAAAPPTLNVLILSGGGEYGAFGAGFLNGWAGVKQPGMERPEFDVVTGVSTGAIIAPFAFVGNDGSYDRISRLYAQPRSDWAVLRGLFFFLPGNPSLLNIDGLQQELRQQVDVELIRQVAEGSRMGRLLCVASTNLDFGEQRVFDLGMEAEQAEKSGNLDRFHQILLASSAIPGALPPRMVDGHLYVDGGATSNILYNPNMTSETSVLGLWRRSYPDRQLPRQRIWVIINEQFLAPPQIVQPTWVDVAGAGLSVMIRSSTHTSVRQLANEVALMRATVDPNIEFRFVAIPNDWHGDTGAGMFNKATMTSLEQIGRKMGADPSSWKTLDHDDLKIGKPTGSSK